MKATSASAAPVSLVTGANRGLGLGLTKLLLARGYIVYGTARHPGGARDLWELEADYPEKFHLVELDVRDELQANLLSEQVKSTQIDVLINNAGICPEYSRSFAELSIDAVREAYEVNVLGVMRVTKSLLPKLLLAKKPKVLNISSSLGSLTENRSGKAYGYRQSKAALNMLTRSLAVDFPQIVFAAMHPGWVNTDMGGAQAPTSVLDSVEGIIQILERLTPKESGQFYDFEGQVLQW